MTSSVNSRIKARRRELGLSDLMVAKLAALSVDQYFDVEAHADEFETVLTLKEAKRLCRVLRLDLFDLVQLKDDGQSEAADAGVKSLVARNEIIAGERKSAGLSREQLADAIGFQEDVVISLESDPDYLDTWSIELIAALSEAIGITPKVLIRDESTDTEP